MNLKIFGNDGINISRFWGITKEYYDQKNEEVETAKDNSKINTLDKTWSSVSNSSFK